MVHSSYPAFNSALVGKRDISLFDSVMLGEKSGNQTFQKRVPALLIYRLAREGREAILVFKLFRQTLNQTREHQ